MPAFVLGSDVAPSLTGRSGCGGGGGLQPLNLSTLGRSDRRPVVMTCAASVAPGLEECCRADRGTGGPMLRNGILRRDKGVAAGAERRGAVWSGAEGGFPPPPRPPPKCRSCGAIAGGRG